MREGLKKKKKKKNVLSLFIYLLNIFFKVFIYLFIFKNRFLPPPLSFFYFYFFLTAKRQYIQPEKRNEKKERKKYKIYICMGKAKSDWVIKKIKKIKIKIKLLSASNAPSRLSFHMQSFFLCGTVYLSVDSCLWTNSKRRVRLKCAPSRPQSPPLRPPPPELPHPLPSDRPPSLHFVFYSSSSVALRPQRP